MGAARQQLHDRICPTCSAELNALFTSLYCPRCEDAEPAEAELSGAEFLDQWYHAGGGLSQGNFFQLVDPSVDLMPYLAAVRFSNRNVWRGLGPGTVMIDAVDHRDQPGGRVLRIRLKHYRGGWADCYETDFALLDFGEFVPPGCAFLPC